MFRLTIYLARPALLSSTLLIGLYLTLGNGPFWSRFALPLPLWLLMTVALYLIYRHKAKQLERPYTLLQERLSRFPEIAPHLNIRSPLPEFSNLTLSLHEWMQLQRGQLQSSELEKELLHSLFDSLSDGVFCVNARGWIVFRNQSVDPALLPRTAIGKAYFQVIRHPRMLEYLHDTIQSHREKEPRLDTTLEGLSEISLDDEEEQNGGEGRSKSIDLEIDTRYYSMQCQPILIAGSAELYLVILKDRTREEATRRMREDFLQNASHELKTPITSIRGYTETMLYRSADEKSRNFLQAIMRNVDRMQRIIEDMVTISSLESKSAPFHPEIFTIRTWMEEIGELVNGTLTHKDQQLAVSIDPAGAVVRADRLWLEHLLVNLIVNASRYSPESSTIYVDFRKGEANQTLLSVADEGPGIAAELQSKIFERFFRIDKNRARNEGGTGLGLSIVRHAARLHGGRVSVSNRPEGGAIFRVELPQ